MKHTSKMKATAYAGFLELFEAGDVGAAGAWLREHSELASHTGYAAHPWLREFVSRNKGHCYKPSHLQIADLLIPARVRTFRDAVLEDRLKEVRDRIREDPKLVSAEFTAGRGIAQAIHHWRSIAIGELLLDAGADIDALTTVHAIGETPLAMQVRFGTVAGSRFLLDRGADPNRGMLMHMPSCSMPELLKLLLGYGWDINGGGLHHDANHGHGERIRILLEHGADPNLQNSEGQTALHIVAARGTGREAIGALVAVGADLNMQDHQGRTPLDLAKSAKSQTATRDLLRLEAEKT